MVIYYMYVQHIVMQCGLSSHPIQGNIFSAEKHPHHQCALPMRRPIIQKEETVYETNSKRLAMAAQLIILILFSNNV